MKLSSRIKPISYVKAHALRDRTNARRPGRALGHHPERRSQGGPAGHRQLREDPGSHGAAQDARVGQPADRGRSGANRDGCDHAVAGALMAFRVQLTDDAARDLEEICDYIDRHDSPARADYVLDRIEEALQGLSAHPQRGRFPERTARHRDSRVPGGLFQALSHHLPGDRGDGLRPRHRRRAA